MNRKASDHDQRLKASYLLHLKEEWGFTPLPYALVVLALGAGCSRKEGAMSNAEQPVVAGISWIPAIEARRTGSPGLVFMGDEVLGHRTETTGSVMGCLFP